MSISSKSFYHGAVLYEITQSEQFTSINKVPNLNSSSTYQLNHNIGLYIKYSSSDDSPWRFTFTSEHQDDVRRLFDVFGERTFIVLVCGEVGFCIVDYGVFASCIDLNHTETEWIEISRPGGGSFRIRGVNGQYCKSIPLNSFPRIIFE